MIGNQFSPVSQPLTLPASKAASVAQNPATALQDQFIPSQPVNTPSLRFGFGEEKIYTGNPHWLFDEINTNGSTYVIERGSASLTDSVFTGHLNVPDGGLKLTEQSTLNGSAEVRDRVEITDQSIFNGNLTVTRAPVVMQPNSELNGNVNAAVTQIPGGHAQLSGAKINGNVNINFVTNATVKKGLVLEARNTEFGKNAKVIQVSHDPSAFPSETPLLSVLGDKITVSPLMESLGIVPHRAYRSVTVTSAKTTSNTAPVLDLRGPNTRIANEKLDIIFDKNLPEGTVFVSNPYLSDKLNIQNGRLLYLVTDPDGDITPYLKR